MFIQAIKKTSFYISILFLCTQCQQGFILHQKIVDNYYIIAPGIYERAALCFQTKDDWANYGELVPATVFAVGYNNEYMIVKQHPLLSFTNAIDKTTTNYYILPILKTIDWSTKNGLMGPLSLEDFDQWRKELRIENIPFTKVIKDLE
jgi:hypothetical protein